MSSKAGRCSSSAPGEGLNRQAIVTAALRSIDRDGAQDLTMRRLGKELGVEAMALYRYVTGREDLLEAVVTMLLEDLRTHLDDELTGTWQGYVQTLPTRSGGLPSTTPRRSRSSLPVTPQHPGCDRRYGAWSWSKTSSPTCRVTGSPMPRSCTPTERSVASCSATCCWSPRYAARKRHPSRNLSTKATPRSPTETASRPSTPTPPSSACSPCSARTTAPKEFEISRGCSPYGPVRLIHQRIDTSRPVVCPQAGR